MIQPASRPPAQDKSEKPALFDKAPVNILVVDDIPEKILAYEAILEDLGQNIVTATSGSQALKLLLRQEFAVILLDVNMPDMDGFEIANFIRTRKKSAHTPIIFLTAFTDEIRMAQGYASGAVDYLPTPVVPEVLKAKVQVFIELAQMRRQAALQAEEHAMRKSAEEAAQRSNFLMNSSDAFARAQHYDDIRRALLTLPLSYLSDISMLWLEDSGAPQRFIARKTADGQWEEEAVPPHMCFPQLEKYIRHASETGEPQHPGLIPLSALSPSGPGEVVALHDTVKADVLVLPFVVRGSFSGVMVLARKDIRNCFAISKITLASDLLSKAASAWENLVLLEKIRESDRRKDEFLAMLAHELRNPLAPIQNALYVIKQSQDAALRAEAETTIERQVRHMVHLVDDLMDVSRITQGKIELRKEQVNLKDALLHAIETAQPLVRQRGHTLEVTLPEDPVWLDADFSRISQIFSNLLTNAAKYTNDKGRISLSVQVEEAGTHIVVSDNGIGIPAAMISRIFDIFSQVDTSLERSQGGLGIGLNLARNLVQMHGGTITAHSRGSQQGSEFRVSLPLHPNPVTPAQLQAEPQEAASQKPVKVLVVDDNEASAKTLGWMLEIFACDITLSHDGPNAIEMARKLIPDVILLDIGLPGMNGYEVCRLLKNEPGLGATTFVAQTGWGQAEDRRKSQSVGFDYHLVKPVDVNILSSIISQSREKQRAG